MPSCGRYPHGVVRATPGVRCLRDHDRFLRPGPVWSRDGLPGRSPPKRPETQTSGSPRGETRGRGPRPGPRWLRLPAPSVSRQPQVGSLRRRKGGRGGPRTRGEQVYPKMTKMSGVGPARGPSSFGDESPRLPEPRGQCLLVNCDVSGLRPLRPRRDRSCGPRSGPCTRYYD